MSLQNCDVYKARWDARAYLHQYYSKSYIPDDEEAYYNRVIPYFKNTGRRYARAIDFGCGPTVHLLTPIAPWVDEIHLADYMPGNLVEIHKWLQGDAGAHNWDLNVGRVLEIEAGTVVTPLEIEARKKLLRRNITALKECDVRQTDPLGDRSKYDLLLSAYCIDAATDSKQEWRRMMGNMLSLCADGATVVLLSARNSDHYDVEDSKFPCANVNEEDFLFSLSTAGFDETQASIKAIEIKDWADDGIDSIFIAIATRGSKTHLPGSPS